MAKRVLWLFSPCLLSFLHFIDLWLVAIVDTYTNGIFIQEQLVNLAKNLNIKKFNDSRLSFKEDVFQNRSILRKYKLDNLPQLFNVLKGK
jgi:lipopolysaccharide/colanic/teichoic acid biosynthesis glycosyltransferase